MHAAQHDLQPPFAAEKSLVEPSQIIHPAAVRRDHALVSPEHDLPAFLSAELRTPKMDELHSWLWLAGLPFGARSLQRQRMMSRIIFLTECPDEHLVWYRDRLFLKPLPSFLLCHSFWESNLCQDPALYRSACGMLLSYVWLVQYESDFDWAKELALIPNHVEWFAWVSFLKNFLSRIDLHTLEQVDRRYQYGELRLSRLNLLTRYFVPSLWSRKNFVFGFISTSTWYTAFFQRNFGWLLGVFAYVSIVLTALQLGLATQLLKDSTSFQSMCYGITLASVAGAFVGVAGMLIVWFGLFWYHLLSTIFFTRKVLKGQKMAHDEKVARS